ncbi:MAG: transporter substrate-binding domain-containing protein [Gammaproteobacteria bacterium]|nr:transporter substrate-binding domain-containing protein [Gammaproteobacteria bacterium]
MKNDISRTATSLNRIYSLLFFMFAHSVCHAESETVRVSADPWVPWTIGKEGEAPGGGWAFDVAKELFQRMAVSAEYAIYPYERCLRQMESGESDVLLMVKKTPEREAYMAYSSISLSDPQLLYYAKDRFKLIDWNQWQDLKDYTVAGVRGFNYGEFNEAAKQHEITFEVTADDILNVKKLLAGRVDLVILNRSTAIYLEDQYPEFRGKISHAVKPIATGEFFIALSKKGRAIKMKDEVDRVLTKMRDDGTLDRITASIN